MPAGEEATEILRLIWGELKADHETLRRVMGEGDVRVATAVAELATDVRHRAADLRDRRPETERLANVVSSRSNSGYRRRKSRFVRDLGQAVPAPRTDPR